MISLYELLHIAASQSMKIDSLWNIFIGVHIIILGGLVYINRHITIAEKLIAWLLYVLFLVMNFTAIHTSYVYMAAILADLQTLYGEEALQMTDYMTSYASGTIQRNILVVINIAFLVAFVMTSLSIFFVNQVLLAKK